MLRLKLAFEECDVAQAQLAREAGYSKALVSRALSNGEMPVDLDRFIGAVALFVRRHEGLCNWLEKKGLELDALFERVDAKGRTIATLTRRPVELDGAILAVAGRALLQGPKREEAVGLSSVALYLLEKLREQPIGMDELGEIEMTAGRLLAGGAS